MKNAMTTTVTMRATVTPTRARARGMTRGTTTRTRAVDVGVATAVAQQDLALAVCVISEAVMTRERVAEGTPGRPDLGFVGRGCGALVGAFALIQSDNELATPTGLVLAAAATLGLGYQYARRFLVQVKRLELVNREQGQFELALERSTPSLSSQCLTRLRPEEASFD